MDEIDRASIEIERTLERSLEKRVTFVGKSALFCEECDEPIPEARRQSLQGVKICVFCAEEAEARNRLKLT